MSAYRRIVHVENEHVLVRRARWCDTFLAKLRGFTFRKSLPAGEGLVLVEKSDNRVNTAIHMLFVFMDLGVIWADGQGRVVDKVLARPWRLSYAPQSPARYVIETDPDVLSRVQIGDHVRFEEVQGG
ncbi:MAG: DUF192 domain-containing protein [bacterium]